MYDYGTSVLGSGYPLALLVLAIVFIVLSTSKLKLHPFLALILAALGFGLCSKMPLADVAKSVNDGFGGTIGSIGIVIIFGTIIGSFLEKSGGAQSLADSTLRVTGEKNVPLAMGIIGYIVSMPVFCDSGFVLLSPLNKALSRKAGTSIAAGGIALSLGLYATHTMVPPTPGPIGAAGILKADLALVIMWGMAIAAAAMVIGWIFAITVAAREKVTEEVTPSAHPLATPTEDRPGTIKAVIPIILPIILIILQSIAKYPTKPFGEGPAVTWLIFLGQPIIALFLGVLFALLLPKKFDRNMLSGGGWVGEAVIASAIIIIITGAGGSFGKVLQNSGIADTVGSLLKDANMGIWLPFLIAAGIKTAQGSSTVSMITTAGIVLPLLPALGLDSETGKALATVGIGAGAMVVSHANDSYFWVVSQFTGLSVQQGYRLQTLGTLIEGVGAGIVLWVVSLAVL